MKKYFKCSKLLYNSRLYNDKYLVIENNLVGEMLEIDVKIPEDAEIIDYTGYTIAAGYVDVHIHGISNADVMDASFESIETISNSLAKIGVTSYLPTTLTSSVEKLNEVCTIIGENLDKFTGSRIQGIFLEGPFFTEKYKGAQNPKYFLDPSLDVLKNWQKLSKNNIKKIAIAPERKGAEKFIKNAKKLGIYTVIGHSDASYEQASKALEVGANGFVHLFNGMSPLNHRNPGMVGAALLSGKDVYCEAICDGHHLHPATVKLIHKVIGPDNIALITDCMMAGNMPDGKYILGEFDVTVENGTARLDSGNLAGSILKLKDAVKNVVNWGVCSLEEALNMASIVPAKSVGIDDVCGVLKKGRIADFIVLDKDLEVVKTYMDGKCE